MILSTDASPLSTSDVPQSQVGSAKALGRSRRHFIQPATRRGDWQKWQDSQEHCPGMLRKVLEKVKVCGALQGQAGESGQDGILDVLFEICGVFFIIIKYI